MKDAEAALEAADKEAAALLQTIQERPLTKKELLKAVQVLGAAGRLEKQAQREAEERERLAPYYARKREIEAERAARYEAWLERQREEDREAFPNLEHVVAAIRAGEFRTLTALGKRYGWAKRKVSWMKDAAVRRGLITVAEFYSYFPQACRHKKGLKSADANT